MLKRIHIQNLAVVEDVDLEFEDGLNVLTGSTGAGKSLILSAVNILLGERVGAKVIRAGQEQAIVEGEFSLGRLPVLAAELVGRGEGAAPHVLVLRREVHGTGRSHAFLNGRPCTIKQLQSICRQLIEPHGQNEQLRLKIAENHVAYVDRVAEHGELLESYRERLAQFREAASRLAEFDIRATLLREKKELYEHRVDELERAGLVADEKTHVEESIRIIENAQVIYDALGEACELTRDNEASAASLLAQSLKGLGRIRDLDGRFAAFAEQLESAEIILEETARDMRACLDGLEFDPQRLQTLQERLSLLMDLERRYQMAIPELIGERDRWRRELESMVFEGEERAVLDAERGKRLDSVRRAAVRLSVSRKAAAANLDAAMTREIEQLMMRGARFRTDFSYDVIAGGRDAGGVGDARDRADIGAPDAVVVDSGGLRADAGAPDAVVVDGIPVRLGEGGIDVVVFHVQTNPGEAEGPVSDIASSGELSRIALALKSVTSIGREGSVLIFDELDAGVGADLGEMIASKLEAIARHYQIICITHMPQIAARGRRHLVVSKDTKGDRTFTRVGRVEKIERLDEIARMLGGKAGSEKRLALAREMLQDTNGKTTPDVRP